MSKIEAESTEIDESNDNNDVFEEAYNAIKQQVDVKKFRATDVITFTALAMRLVERYPTLTGPEKKSLVIRLATRLVSEIPKLKKEDKAALDLMIQMALPSAIDHLIAASKGELELNIAAPSGGFVSCLPCFKVKTAPSSKK